MSLPPRSRAEALDAFTIEATAEKVASLAMAGRRVEQALAALRAAGPERQALVKEAADAVWKFFVQRELCGLRDQAPVIAHYRIPKEVLNRLGAR